MVRHMQKVVISMARILFDCTSVNDSNHNTNVSCPSAALSSEAVSALEPQPCGKGWGAPLRAQCGVLFFCLGGRGEEEAGVAPPRSALAGESSESWESCEGWGGAARAARAAKAPRAAGGANAGRRARAPISGLGSESCEGSERGRGLQALRKLGGLGELRELRDLRVLRGLQELRELRESCERAARYL